VLSSDRFDVAKEGMTAVPVRVVRKGYQGPIELVAKGAKGLSGKAIIKAGANAAVLPIRVEADDAVGADQFHVIGKAKIEDKSVVQTANAKAAVVQALNGLPYPPMHLPTFVALAVKEKANFSLAIQLDPPEVEPGKKLKVTITATRQEGFDGEITLTPPIGLPAAIALPKMIPPIGKDQTESSFSIELNAKAPVGEYFLLLTGKMKHDGKDLVEPAPPVLLTIRQPGK
jgi:hypothetical protein